MSSSTSPSPRNTSSSMVSGSRKRRIPAGRGSSDTPTGCWAMSRTRTRSVAAATRPPSATAASSRPKPATCSPTPPSSSCATRNKRFNFPRAALEFPAMIKGKATPEGTATYAKNHPGAHPHHWKNALGLTLSSVGMGSYLGNADPITDGKYAAAFVKTLDLGINVVDSAINYRYQRSERNLGVGLKTAVDAGAVARDQVLLCTKGGFISGDMGPPTKEWFEETYLKPGIITAKDIVAGCHCMTPKYLRHEVEQSRN